MLPSLKRLNRILLCVFLVLTLVVVACGGGGDDDEDEATATPEATSEDTTGDGGEADEETVSIDEAFYHSGWMVEVEDANLTVEESALGDSTYVVTIEARFTNLGEEQTAFSADYALVRDGDSINPSFDSEIPQVGGGLTSEGSFIFVVDEDFAFSDTALVIGGTEEVKAQVPLGSQAGELIALEPTEPPISGTISLTLIDLNVQSAELRADVPVTYSEVEEDKLALTLYFSALSRKSGNWQIFAQDFALIEPDGTATAPDGVELGSLPGSDIGVTTEDLYVRFIVDDPAEGSYTLRFKPGSYWIEGGPDQGDLTFEISEDGASSPTP